MKPLIKYSILLFCSLSASGTYADGEFQSCADMLNGASCKDIDANSEVAKQCCPANLAKSNNQKAGLSQQLTAISNALNSNSANGSISRYLQCAYTLFAPPLGGGVLFDRKVPLIPLSDETSGNLWGIMVPSTQGTQKGLYVYTKESAYFLPFPANGVNNNELGYTSYKMKVTVPGHGLQTLNYSDPKSPKDMPMGTLVNGQNKSAEDLKQYTTITPTDEPNSSARAALSSAVQQGVEQESQVAAVTLGQMKQYGNTGDLATFATKVEAKMDKCKVDGDKTLTSAAYNGAQLISQNAGFGSSTTTGSAAAGAK
jgi:hypothetical protein